MSGAGVPAGGLLVTRSGGGGASSRIGARGVHLSTAPSFSHASWKVMPSMWTMKSITSALKSQEKQCTKPLDGLTYMEGFLSG